MPTAKEILNELKWREDRDFTVVEVDYIHRGAPSDLMTASGDEIRNLGNSFMETTSASIPYHRITEIRYDGDVVWRRH